MSGATVNRYLFAASLSVFLIICGPALFSEGMFLDGLMYAGISENLANGYGSFWNLFYTKTVYSQFNEHPPLAVGLQALFFKVFGEGIWVERLYSLGTFLTITLMTVKLWKLISGSFRHSWVLVLFFSTIPLMTWSTANNMLENTMSIFTVSAAYFYFLAQQKQQRIYLFLSGVLLFLAFLSKGFTGLFVWTLPVALYLSGTRNARSAFSDLGLFLSGTLAVAGCTFLLVPESFDAIVRYFDRQVKGSLENVQTVSNRFYIIGKMITELLIPLGMLLILHLVLRYRGIQWSKSNIRKEALSFIVVGCSGVVPIAISMKQSGFYIVCTFPFFVLGLVGLFSGQLDAMQDQITKLKKAKLLVKTVAVSFVAAMVIVSVVSSQKVGRDKERIMMVKEVMNHVEKDEIVKIDGSMMTDWGLHAYFCRYADVSLSSGDLNQKYLLSYEKQEHDLVVQSGNYFLYLIND